MYYSRPCRSAIALVALTLVATATLPMTSTAHQVEQRSNAPVEACRSGRYERLIHAAANRHKVPAALVKAVIKVESDFDHLALSKAGARGLMQLMPGTAGELGVREPSDPAQNIEGGTRYLRRQKDRFGSWVLALAAYNAGGTRVAKHKGVPPFPETIRYVSRVTDFYAKYGGVDDL